MRARIAVLTVALAVVAAPTAHAGWLPPEPVGTDISQLHLAPGAVGWVTGFYATGPSRARFRLRPLGGTLGPVNEFPGTSGTVTETDPKVWFDDAGNAIVA